MVSLPRLNLRLPIVGAPMAGVSTPALAAAVSTAGGLGSISIGASSVEAARRAIDETRALVGSLPFAVNVFCHPSPRQDTAESSKWLDALTPSFRRYSKEPPSQLQSIYTTFDENPEMIQLLVAAKVPVVSFHFGLPSRRTMDAIKSAGSLMFASVTNLEEAKRVEAHGLDAIVAQGYEAGGHRSTFNVDQPDEKLGMMALTQLLVQRQTLPIIAAGGIMDGTGIAAVLKLGAVAAQLGTAFVPCPESAASEAYRSALLRAQGTEMVDIISGRPARTISNRWTELLASLGNVKPPDYPIAYDAAKKLHAAAMQASEHGFGAQWAGQGVRLARSLPAPELMLTLEKELQFTEGFDRFV